MASCAHAPPSRRGPLVLEAPIAVALSALLLTVQLSSAGLCPARCRCDDQRLRSNCAHGALDIVPIQLNPQIRELDLSGNRISGLHMAFEFYGNLERLNLSSNLIHTLGTNNFKLQQRLVSLNLSSNGIRSLARLAFHGLSVLKSLDLSDNNITEIDEQSFRHTSELEELDLSGNSIDTVPPGLFANLYKIREVDLSGNRLLEPPGPSLALVPSLERLDLADNLLEELGKTSLPSMPALTRLVLADNYLRSVSQDAFDRIPGLLFLDLSGNNLTSVPSRALSKLSMLTRLLLSRNHLTELKNMAFRNLFELRSLELEDCAIWWVDTFAFADNVNLEWISMDGNRELAELPARLLYTAGNLRWVSLRGCNLASLQPTQFPIDKLAALRVGGNPIVCNCSVHWLWNVLRVEDRRNDSRLQVDSQEIVCANEEFAGVALVNLPEGSLRCRLNSLYLSLSAAGCLVATAAILTLVAHFARAKRRKRVPTYTAPTRPELLVYVGAANDQLVDKHRDYYNRRLIATEDSPYDPAHQDYQESRRKSDTESLESRETNIYETPRYSRPSRLNNESFNSFYQDQRSISPESPDRNRDYSSPSDRYATRHRQEEEQEAVYAVTDLANLRDEPPEVASFAGIRNHGDLSGERHHHGSNDRDYNFEPTQKPHIVFV